MSMDTTWMLLYLFQIIVMFNFKYSYCCTFWMRLVIFTTVFLGGHLLRFLVLFLFNLFWFRWEEIGLEVLWCLKLCMSWPELQYIRLEMECFPIVCPLLLNFYETMRKGSNICFLFCSCRRYAFNMLLLFCSIW